eukprot:1955908-Amphidinium_carterae.1
MKTLLASTATRLSRSLRPRDQHRTRRSESATIRNPQDFKSLVASKRKKHNLQNFLMQFESLHEASIYNHRKPTRISRLMRFGVFLSYLELPYCNGRMAVFGLGLKDFAKAKRADTS